MLERKVTTRFAVRFTAERSEEDEILRPSVITEVCNSAKIPLPRLLMALMILQLDHGQASVIRESNLFGRLLDVYEQSTEPESRCLVLRCLSEAMENMHRNEVFEIATLVANAQLGHWCVEKLYTAMDERSQLLRFATYIVKVSKNDRDLIISQFILPKFTTIFREERDTVLLLIENASQHECHSDDMFRLFETALHAVMGELVTLSERCLTYELVLNIVNNYLFDRCDNLDTCLQCGFDDWVWNIILTTGQMTDAEVEFMMSYVNHVPELTYALFDRFSHLCEMLNIGNCAEVASLLRECVQQCSAEQKHQWFQLFHCALRISMAHRPQMAFNRKVVLADLCQFARAFASF